MTLRDLLLHAYPRSWQQEFGPELAAILATQRLTAALIADVLLSAAGQHFRRDPWKLCALSLALWTTGLMVAGFQGMLVSRVTFLWLYLSGQLFVFAAGAATALGRDSGIWKATSAAAKAAIFPAIERIVPSAILYGAQFLRDERVWYPALMNILVTFAVSLVFGFAGALIGRGARHFRKPSHAGAN